MEYCFYQLSEIHPSHIDQIARAAMRAEALWRENAKEAEEALLELCKDYN